MFIAIDDTYGPETLTNSSYVTGLRRTHVAVVFPDDKVKEIQDLVKKNLEAIKSIAGFSPVEFHFVDIYNRKSPWDVLPDKENLRLIEKFVDIYRSYRWRVFLQTIDVRTLRDHGIGKFEGKIDGLDLSKPADLSLLWLLLKIKSAFKASPEEICLLLDEGRKKPGAPFGNAIFKDWPARFNGRYAASSAEPLLQIADFVAFCINRSTHLAFKEKRTEIDYWFLGAVGSMDIACDDLILQGNARDFTPIDFDEIHRQDRVRKGLEKK